MIPVIIKSTPPFYVGGSIMCMRLHNELLPFITFYVFIFFYFVFSYQNITNCCYGNCCWQTIISLNHHSFDSPKKKKNKKSKQLSVVVVRFVVYGFCKVKVLWVYKIHCTVVSIFCCNKLVINNNFLTRLVSWSDLIV